jgi:signal transduction histidine kinase
MEVHPGLTQRRAAGSAWRPGRLLLAPLSAPAWRATMHVLLDLPIGVATFTVFAVILAIAFGMLWVLLLGVPILWFGLLLARGVAVFERLRFSALLGEDIPAPRLRPTKGTLWGAFARDFSSGATWRALAYAAIVLPVVGTIGATLITALWSAGIALSLLPAYAWALPTSSIAGFDRAVSVIGWTALGLLTLLSAPWAARGMAWIDVQIGRGLLGASTTAQLAARVQTLQVSRADMVSAADAERRRIERDLHDGAQQRLVALAMNLGMAKAKLDDDPEAAKRLVTRAHDDAKQALAELRDLARGIHPAVLADRGLDAALSALAARSPVPVSVRVQLPQRPSPTIEAVAYFVVAEALTNIAKHAQASRADIVVWQVEDRLRVDVTDNGRGGADMGGGSGLAGLAGRVAAVDGSMYLSSPPGGPTRLYVELPCVS